MTNLRRIRMLMLTPKTVLHKDSLGPPTSSKSPDSLCDGLATVQETTVLQDLGLRGSTQAIGYRTKRRLILFRCDGGGIRMSKFGAGGAYCLSWAAAIVRHGSDLTEKRRDRFPQGINRSRVRVLMMCY